MAGGDIVPTDAELRAIRSLRRGELGAWLTVLDEHGWREARDMLPRLVPAAYQQTSTYGGNP